MILCVLTILKNNFIGYQKNAVGTNWYKLSFDFAQNGKVPDRHQPD